MSIEQVKTLIASEVETKSAAIVGQVEEVKSAVASQVEEVKSGLDAQLLELKNLVADLEAKGATAGQAVAALAEFDTKAAGEAIRTAGARNGSGQVTSLKGLTTGGGALDGSAAPAIDEELGRTITERAREMVTILSLVGTKSVSSVNYRELVLVAFPTTGVNGESIVNDASNVGAYTPWAVTQTQTYAEVVMKVGKIIAKPRITDEALADPAIDVWSHLQTLLTEELSRAWAVSVLRGDNTANSVRGIIGDIKGQSNSGTNGGHMNVVGSTGGITGGSFSPTWAGANTARDVDVFPVMVSGVDGEFGEPNANGGTDGWSAEDFLIDIIAALPTNHLGSAQWVMNRRTLAKIRKIRDEEGRSLVTFDKGAFSILGYNVAVEDYMDNVSGAADNVAVPVMFGDFATAYKLCDIDENFLVDPYSVDGAVQIKTSQRKGSLIGSNSAVIGVLLTAATVTVPA